MYEILADKVFTSSFKDGLEIPHYIYAVLKDTPDKSLFKTGSHPDEWQFRRKADRDGVFCWAEGPVGIFKYGLYREKDPMHNNRAYWWSSNHITLNWATGKTTCHVDYGHFAIDNRFVVTPEKFAWVDNYSWLTPIAQDLYSI
jgi:hypothetical protein